MDRRGFLKLFGVGAGVAIVAPELLLPEPEPVRRYWQVSRNAPVDVHHVGFDFAHQTDRTSFAWFRYDPGSGLIRYETPEPAAWDLLPIQQQYDEILAKQAEIADMDKRHRALLERLERPVTDSDLAAARLVFGKSA